MHPIAHLHRSATWRLKRARRAARPRVVAARDRMRDAIPDSTRTRIENLRYALWLRRHHREQLTNQPDIAQGLKNVESRWPDLNHAPDDPIIVASAGWRSGSTLLQRLIMANGSVLVWGEPYNRLDVVRSLARPFRGFTQDWPGDDVRWLANTDNANLAQDWIANLYPDGPDLIEAHREFFRRLFAQPALEAGYERWGLKEVRLDADHARYLKFLFPQAQIIFLIRDPYRAYASYRRMGSRWYDSWPDSPVFGPASFGRVWRRLADSFLTAASDLDSWLVRYEDLTAGHGIDELSTWLRIPLDSRLLDDKITPKPRRRRLAGEPSAVETALLRRAVEPLASRLGYEPTGRIPHGPTVT